MTVSQPHISVWIDFDVFLCDWEILKGAFLLKTNLLICTCSTSSFNVIISSTLFFFFAIASINMFFCVDLNPQIDTHTSIPKTWQTANPQALTQMNRYANKQTQFTLISASSVYIIGFVLICLAEVEQWIQSHFIMLGANVSEITLLLQASGNLFIF